MQEVFSKIIRNFLIFVAFAMNFEGDALSIPDNTALNSDITDNNIPVWNQTLTVRATNKAGGIDMVVVNNDVPIPNGINIRETIDSKVLRSLVTQSLLSVTQSLRDSAPVSDEENNGMFQYFNNIFASIVNQENSQADDMDKNSPFSVKADMAYDSNNGFCVTACSGRVDILKYIGADKDADKFFSEHYSALDIIFDGRVKKDYFAESALIGDENINLLILAGRGSVCLKRGAEQSITIRKVFVESINPVDLLVETTLNIGELSVPRSKNFEIKVRKNGTAKIKKLISSKRHQINVFDADHNKENLKHGNDIYLS